VSINVLVYKNLIKVCKTKPELQSLLLHNEFTYEIGNDSTYLKQDSWPCIFTWGSKYHYIPFHNYCCCYYCCCCSLL